jgi:enamine deaminase RidA (YjgF/YER057c/UK114 family)
MTNNSIEAKLKEMGLELPSVAKPVAAYVPAVKCGNLVFTSGQIPLVKGELSCKGKVGKDCTEEQAYAAAKICALNCLAAIKDQIGSLDKIERVVKVVGFVNCVDSFTMQPKVINGASEFLGALFGDKGQHARSAVGVNVLPLDSSVEVEMIVKVSE